MLSPEQIAACRKQFPGLSRIVAGREAVFLDGPAGTQVPEAVIEAVSVHLAFANANHGGLFATSIENDAVLEDAHRAAADLFGVEDAHTTYFGANMTSLTFALSRTLGRTWSPGDEIIVTRLDHDANIRPWVLAARDAGATVRWIDFHPEDCTLNLEQLRDTLSSKTKLLAVGCASNSTGGINPVQEICRWAKAAGALVFLDAVHYAPHALLDIPAWGCDFLACSAYKFFGPHVGILWGRRELLEGLEAYKVRPAPNDLPGKWMTGTQNHEGIAGVLAAIDYLAVLGRTAAEDSTLPRRAALEAAFAAIREYEQALTARLLAGLADWPEIRVWGITEGSRLAERLPTVSITHAALPAEELVGRLAKAGIFAWHGNYYALELSEALGREPAGMVRLGLVHYNTAEEVDYLLETLRRIASSS